MQSKFIAGKKAVRVIDDEKESSLPAINLLLLFGETPLQKIRALHVLSCTLEHYMIGHTVQEQRGSFSNQLSFFLDATLRWSREASELLLEKKVKIT
jgi:hypothetical protein